MSIRRGGREIEKPSQALFPGCTDAPYRQGTIELELAPGSLVLPRWGTIIRCRPAQWRVDGGASMVQHRPAIEIWPAV